MTGINPDLQSLVNMAVSKLNAVSEAVTDADKATSVKVAKDLKQARGLLDVIREEINDLRKAKQTAPVKVQKK